LRRHTGIEVFAPRIRFRRPTRLGLVWVTEALFPNYFFARFDWQSSLRLVHHSPDVRGVVHFGDDWPTIPDQTIEHLRSTLGLDEVHVIPMSVQPGDSVQVVSGSFQGFDAIITKVAPARERVAVLLDFLGRQTSVELDLAMVARQDDQRAALIKSASENIRQ